MMINESFKAVLEVKFLIPSWFSLMLIKQTVKSVVSCMILN